jgi:hypothetical protein
LLQVHFVTYLLKALDALLALFFRCIIEILLIILNVVIICAKCPSFRIILPIKKIKRPKWGSPPPVCDPELPPTLSEIFILIRHKSANKDVKEIRCTQFSTTPKPILEQAVNWLLRLAVTKFWLNLVRQIFAQCHPTIRTFNHSLLTDQIVKCIFHKTIKGNFHISHAPRHIFCRSSNSHIIILLKNEFLSFSSNIFCVLRSS